MIFLNVSLEESVTSRRVLCAKPDKFKSVKNLIIYSVFIAALICCGSLNAAAQGEVLTNLKIIEMARVGLGSEIILKKIKNSPGAYDVSVNGLSELKKAGVSDEIITVIMEIDDAKAVSNIAEKPVSTEPKTAAQLLREAKNIAFVKGSAYPSLKEVESSLMSRERSERWRRFNLNIVQDQTNADLICEIGHDFLTHYNFRVTDVKTGRTIAASGVTSLGGALAGNVANKLIKRLNEVLSSEEKTK